MASGDGMALGDGTLIFDFFHRRRRFSRPGYFMAELRPFFHVQKKSIFKGPSLSGGSGIWKMPELFIGHPR
jgi:hypothetical protein